MAAASHILSSGLKQDKLTTVPASLWNELKGNRITKLPLTLNRFTLLWHNSTFILQIQNPFTFPPEFKRLLQISLAVAKKVVFQNWKSRNSCHISFWIKLISQCKKSHAHQKKHRSAFEDLCKPFRTFLNPTTAYNHLHPIWPTSAYPTVPLICTVPALSLECLSVCLFVLSLVCLSLCPVTCLSVCLSLCSVLCLSSVSSCLLVSVFYIWPPFSVWYKCECKYYWA